MPRIEGGWVQARGALDDKGSLVSVLEAVEHLIQRGYAPRRTIYLAFGHDEERGGPAGLAGAKQIADELRARHVHAALVIDEGAMLDEAASPVKGKQVALIAIAQKGWVSVRLTASGTGGHAMAPPVDGRTVIAELAHAVTGLEQHQHPFRVDPSVDRMLDAIGPEMPLIPRAMLANRWLFRPLIVRMLSRTATTASILRTTMAPTVIASGFKESSLPETGYVIVNFRTLPGETSADLLAWVRSVVRDQRVSVALNGDAPHEPTPMSRVTSDGYGILQRTIRELFPGTIVAPGLYPGRTDAEYYRSIADDAYLFAPYLFSPELIGTVHGHDERIPVRQFLSMARFYVRLIENLDGAMPRPGRAAG